MKIYLDSSAIVKRVADEADSDALIDLLDAAVGAGAVAVASALARVEVGRALRTRIDVLGPRAVARASVDAFDGISIAAIHDTVIEQARIVGPPLLRSLDAIHLATASLIGADEVWTYDARLADAAEGLGLLARAPTD